MAGESELTPPEEAQAVMMARQRLNSWLDAESAYSCELLSDETFESTLLDISVSLDEAPGLLPFVAHLVDVYRLGDESGAVARRVVDVLQNKGF